MSSVIDSGFGFWSCISIAVVLVDLRAAGSGACELAGLRRAILEPWIEYAFSFRMRIPSFLFLLLGMAMVESLNRHFLLVWNSAPRHSFTDDPQAAHAPRGIWLLAVG